MSQPKNEWTLYHNPRCSKSRGALERLAERGITPRVVEYLKSPLDETALEALLKKLGKAPREIVRTKEPKFAELKLDLSDDTAVLRALARHPSSFFALTIATRRSPGRSGLPELRLGNAVVRWGEMHSLETLAAIDFRVRRL